MKLASTRENRPTDNILPMINIVFLLLIFFMLAGALQSADIFEIDPLSSARGSDDQPDPATILVSADGRLGLGSQELGQDALLQEIARRMADNPEMTVRVKADEDAPAVEFVRLMEGLRGIGVKELKLLTLSEAAD